MMHHADAISIGIITLCYLIFAMQLVMQTGMRNFNTKGSKAVFLLVVVFVFCAFAGYLSSLLPPSWWWFREMMHWMLAGASAWLVITNQAQFVAEMLRNDRTDQ